MIGKVSVALLLAAGSALSQRATFEVASVRPAEVSGKKFLMGTQIDGARVDMSAVSLADIVCQAYRLKSAQLRGPDWMVGLRFDIHAKMPEGASKEQVPEMLQALLADRFKMTFHRESKDLAVAALVVAKGGPKLREVEPDAPEPAMKTSTAAAAKSGLHMDRNMTMPAFCDLLGKLLGTAVVDMTGLTATYQVLLDIPLEDVIKMKLNAEANANPTGARSGDAAADPVNNSAIFGAVQQMGLKLEPRKAPMDLLVIDRVEKVPTEN